MLKIENLKANYGHIEALHGVSLEVGDREIVALIGSNGAGKTTLLNSVSGHVTTSGSICFEGEEIGKKKQNNRNFRSLTCFSSSGILKAE